MIKKYAFALIFLLILQTLSATIFYPIDTTELIRATVSSRFQNRIAIDGGRIKKVIYNESQISVTLEEDSGQVFVYALTDFPQTTTVSLVTDDGYVQDIELSFIEGPTEIIILEPAICCEEIPCEPCETIGPGHPEYIVMTIESILGGNVPEGYVACEINPECRRIKKGIRAVLISKLVSLHETLYVWRVENTSRWSQKISEKEMNFQCGNWVYLDRNQLGSCEQIMAIVSVKNYESAI